MNVKHLVVLPLPLNAPAGLATLAGLVYVYTDEHFSPLGNKEVLTLKCLDYCLPSPGYLYAQNIDPYSLNQGLSEEEFIKKVIPLFSPDTIIYTWSLHNLKILNQICMRTLRPLNLCKEVGGIVDLNLCLKVHELFSTGNYSSSSALERMVEKYKLLEKIDDSNNIQRLDHLLALGSYLNTVNPHLLNYMARDKSIHRLEIEKAIANDKYLFELNIHTGTEVLKPLSIVDDKLRALCFDGGAVLYKSYDLYDFGLLSPATVLTEQRQHLLNLDLLDAESHILNMPPQNSAKPNNVKPVFFDSLSAQEQDFLNLIVDKGVPVEKFPEFLSKKCRKMLLLYFGSNHQKDLLDNELVSYFSLCKQYLEKQLSRYSSELSTLYGMATDPKRANLLIKIRHYPLER